MYESKVRSLSAGCVTTPVLIKSPFSSNLTLLIYLRGNESVLSIPPKKKLPNAQSQFIANSFKVYGLPAG